MKGLRWGGYLGAGAAALLAFGWTLGKGESEPCGERDTLVERGRQVYIAEGCIHCHSQYIRPVGRDVELWGPPTRPEFALSKSPVLIGNRRQGPDLSTVGNRLSPDWNRMHLIEPSRMVGGSRMPSFAHLFEEEEGARGEALLAYLDSLRVEKGEQ